MPVLRLFQSTLSRGERHIFFLCPLPPALISIHALTRRAARMPGLGHDWYDISIHALTRRAAKFFAKPFHKFLISIHALTRRAALLTEMGKSRPVISIHALTRRAALNGLIASLVLDSNFNPRSHEESGSICWLCQAVCNDFNPRSHEESGLLEGLQ